MIKPDGVQRGLVGEILSRFEKKGFKIVAAKFGVLPEAIVDKHYEEHLAKPFYPGMKAYITSGPVFRFVLEGDNVIATVRKMNGATNPAEAAPGTVRACRIRKDRRVTALRVNIRYFSGTIFLNRLYRLVRMVRDYRRIIPEILC